MNVERETLAALLTGTGRGAVATVGIDGPRAHELVMSRFTPATSSITSLVLDRIHFGTWTWNDYHEELVVCRVADDRIEVHCHGGPLPAQTILRSLEDAGASVVPALQWLRQSQPTDRFASEALEILPQLQTEKATAIVLDQTRHAMRRALESVQSELEAGNTNAALDKLREIAAFSSLGVRLHQPFRVVLVGPPNAGKSSLVNAMVGFERAIVYDQPGTTRDLVSVSTALQGWPVVLTDTAGLRDAVDPIEQAGIAIASREADEADLLLHIHDLSRDEQPNFDDWVESETTRVISVGTKCDLPTTSKQDLDVLTSAKTGLGIDQLGQRMIQELVPETPIPGAAVPITSWQADAIDSLQSLLLSQETEDAKWKLAQLLRPEKPEF